MPQAAAAAAPRSILVVDDEVDILRFLRETLGTFCTGAVDTSPSSEYAFELALKKPYDLFIFDFSMPVIDGALLYQLIRKTHQFGGWSPARAMPPLILMSGHGEKPRAQKLLHEPGVSGLLAKPFSIDRLLGKVEVCLPGIIRPLKK